eukprot:4711579-Prymnesium_polylepis.1
MSASLQYTMVNYLFRVQQRVGKAREDVKELTAVRCSATQSAGTSHHGVDVKLKWRLSKLDWMITDRKGRMWLKDEHLDVFMRWGYPAGFCAFVVSAYVRLPAKASELSCVGPFDSH